MIDPCLNGKEPESALTIYLSPIPLYINPTIDKNTFFCSTHFLKFPDKEIFYEYDSQQEQWDVKNKDYIITNNKETYQLESFHTHKHGEHTINGKSYPFELHFVFPEPAGQDIENILVLGLLFEIGHKSAKIITDIIAGKPFKLASIKNNFCTYNGSLTKENLEDIHATAVNWNIITSIFTITEKDLKILLAKSRNYSQLRPLNGRNVTYIKCSCDH